MCGNGTVAWREWCAVLGDVFAHCPWTCVSGIGCSGGRWAEHSAFGSGRGERASLVGLTQAFLQQIYM